MLIEQLDCNQLYRWFVGLNIDYEVWDATVFTKNRDRLLGGVIAQVFFRRVAAQARAQQRPGPSNRARNGWLTLFSSPCVEGSAQA